MLESARWGLGLRTDRVAYRHKFPRRRASFVVRGDGCASGLQRNGGHAEPGRERAKGRSLRDEVSGGARKRHGPVSPSCARTATWCAPVSLPPRVCRGLSESSSAVDKRLPTPSRPAYSPLMSEVILLILAARSRQRRGIVSVD